MGQIGWVRVESLGASWVAVVVEGANGVALVADGADGCIDCERPGIHDGRRAQTAEPWREETDTVLVVAVEAVELQMFVRTNDDRGGPRIPSEQLVELPFFVAFVPRRLGDHVVCCNAE